MEGVTDIALPRFRLPFSGKASKPGSTTFALPFLTVFRPRGVSLSKAGEFRDSTSLSLLVRLSLLARALSDSS